MNIICPIGEQAKSAGKNPALIADQQSLSYREVNIAVDNVGRIMAKKNIRPGDVITVLGANSIEQAVLFFASVRMGAIFMPLSTHLNQQQWQSQIKKAKTCLLVSDSNFSLDDVSCDKIDIGEILLLENQTGVTNKSLTPGNPAVIIFSSGSSSEPRGVILTLKNLYYSALGANQVIGLNQGDCWLAVLPFYHVGGLSILFRCALAGATAYISSRFNAERILRLIENRRINIISLVPTMLYQLLQVDKTNLMSGLKAIVLGAAAADQTLMSEIKNRRLPVLTTYGLTETASMITLSPPGEVYEKPGSSGRLLPYRELKIVSIDNKTTKTRREGKILASGAILFSNYLGQPDGEAKREKWFDTGDIGYFDNEGSLFVIARSDRMIVSGGENINLDYIEKTIAEIEGISEAAILPRPDAKWGQRPVAFIVFKDDKINVDKLNRLLAEKLSKIHIPDIIMEVPEIPLTGTGKCDRRALRDKYRELFDSCEEPK